jgi:hypothetical protein
MAGFDLGGRFLPLPGCRSTQHVIGSQPCVSTAPRRPRPARTATRSSAWASWVSRRPGQPLVCVVSTRPVRANCGARDERCLTGSGARRRSRGSQLGDSVRGRQYGLSGVRALKMAQEHDQDHARSQRELPQLITAAA